MHCVPRMHKKVYKLQALPHKLKFTSIRGPLLFFFRVSISCIMSVTFKWNNIFVVRVQATDFLKRMYLSLHEK